MKKVILIVTLALFALTVKAQEEGSDGQTSQGNWLVEVNTGFGSADLATGSNTGIGYTAWKTTEYVLSESYDVDHSLFVFGAEGGYFVADNFAAKAGLGYVTQTTKADLDGAEKASINGFSWMLGSKYYIVSKFPVQLDLRGTSIKDAEENPLWLGIQGGYAWFVGDQLAVEPGLKYSMSLNEDYTDKGVFEFRIGFAAFF